MSEEIFARYCSPTLAGLKTGNMFNWPFESRDELKESLHKWNNVFSKKGLRVIPLRYRGGKALIYMYRPQKLDCDLHDDAACEILRDMGYCKFNTGFCIARLMRKLAEAEDFPHEIGLFLGYPPEDVRGFIENKACKFKCVGCWKVYGDEKKAKALFSQYKECTDKFCKTVARGGSIEQLTVAS